MAMTNRFAHFVKTARGVDSTLSKRLSPQVKLSRIMDLIEKAQAVNLNLGSPAKSYLIRSEELRAEAIATMWDIYYNVLKYVRSTEDESWNNYRYDNATGEGSSDPVTHYGDCFEDYVGAELHGSNSVTKVVRYDD